jgi:hypothetical protein
MTKLLQDVIERVRRWPADRQDEAAKMLLDLEAQRASATRLSVDQLQEVGRIRQAVIDGTAELATDEQVAAFWKSCGL